MGETPKNTVSAEVRIYDFGDYDWVDEKFRRAFSSKNGGLGIKLKVWDGRKGVAMHCQVPTFG